MTNKFDDMRLAVRDAQYTLDAADTVAAQMGSILQGRLRKVSTDVLKRLKRELRDFNMHTGTWRE